MAINNPYVPGDPFSYDLKWIIRKIKEHSIELSTIDARIAAAVQDQLDQHDPVYYKTAAELIASAAKAPSLAYIEGFHAPGDLGANLYYVTSNYNDVLAADFYLTLDEVNRWAIPIITTPFVTPEMFGAVGDGVEDDSDPLITAVKYERVHLTKTYLITKEIALKDNAVIVGGTIIDQVPASTIQYDYPGALLISGLKKVRVQDITIVGPGSRTDATLINRSTIKMVNSNDITITGCTFTDVENAICLRVKKCKDVVIRENKIDYYTFVGIGFSDGCENVIVESNILEHLTGTYTNTYPITLSAHEDVVNVTKHATCINNIITCPFPNWEGIDSHGGTDINISNNTVIGSMTGIAVVENPGMGELATDIVISGNLIELSTDTSYARPVNNMCIVCEGENLVITGNVCKNGGIVADGLGTTSAAIISGENVIVDSNLFENVNGHVIWCNNSNKMTIKNNTVTRWHWTTPAGSFTTSVFFLAANGVNYFDTYVIDNSMLESESTALVARTLTGLAQNGGYILCKDNNIPNGVADGSNRNQYVITPAPVYPLLNGRQGDIVWNSLPSAGNPIGWVCTVSFVNGAGGTWVPLANV